MYDFIYNITQLLEKLPVWSIYIFMILFFIIYSFIYKLCYNFIFNGFSNYMKPEDILSNFSFCKIAGTTFSILYIVTCLILMTRLEMPYQSFIAIFIIILFIITIRSTIKLMDYYINCKYYSYLSLDKEYFSLLGYIEKQDNGKWVVRSFYLFHDITI